MDNFLQYSSFDWIFMLYTGYYGNIFEIRYYSSDENLIKRKQITVEAGV